MNNEFFYCYSIKLHEYLRANGLSYICAGLNENTMRKFWQYKRDDKLNELLRMWRENKPN